MQGTPRFRGAPGPGSWHRKYPRVPATQTCAHPRRPPRPRGPRVPAARPGLVGTAPRRGNPPNSPAPRLQGPAGGLGLPTQRWAAGRAGRRGGGGTRPGLRAASPPTLPEGEEDDGLDGEELEHRLEGPQQLPGGEVEEEQGVERQADGGVVDEGDVEVAAVDAADEGSGRSGGHGRASNDQTGTLPPKAQEAPRGGAGGLAGPGRESGPSAEDVALLRPLPRPPAHCQVGVPVCERVHVCVRTHEHCACCHVCACSLARVP